MAEKTETAEPPRANASGFVMYSEQDTTSGLLGTPIALPLLPGILPAFGDPPLRASSLRSLVGFFQRSSAISAATERCDSFASLRRALLLTLYQYSGIQPESEMALPLPSLTFEETGTTTGH